MSEIVNLICNGGVGDCLQAFPIQHFIYKANKYPLIHVSARNEVFEPLQFLAEGINKLEQLDESLFDEFLKDDNRIKKELNLHENDEFYLIQPDLLYRHKNSFNYKKYNTTPENIRNTRTLMDKWKPEKLISLFLLSNTINYSYFDIGGLAREIALLLSDFTIYLPVLENWANKTIPKIKLPQNLPSNIEVDTKPNFIENIKKAYKSYYTITGDNAFSHICHHLGTRRLVLDSRFPCNKNSIPWVSRWFENINDHVNIENFPKDLAKLIETNIKIEQTNLLPKDYVLRNLNSDWAWDLLFKY